jgi:hypothetical protein
MIIKMSSGIVMQNINLGNTSLDDEILCIYHTAKLPFDPHKSALTLSLVCGTQG